MTPTPKGEQRISDERLADLVLWYDDCCDPPMHTIEQGCTTCDTLRALRELAELRREGWVLVPREPTEQMFDGWISVNHIVDRQFERFKFDGDYGNWLACYQVMLSAAPKVREGM